MTTTSGKALIWLSWMLLIHLLLGLIIISLSWGDYVRPLVHHTTRRLLLVLTLPIVIHSFWLHTLWLKIWLLFNWWLLILLLEIYLCTFDRWTKIVLVKLRLQAVAENITVIIRLMIRIIIISVWRSNNGICKACPQIILLNMMMYYTETTTKTLPLNLVWLR